MIGCVVERENKMWRHDVSDLVSEEIKRFLYFYYTFGYEKLTEVMRLYGWNDPLYNSLKEKSEAELTQIMCRWEDNEKGIFLCDDARGTPTSNNGSRIQLWWKHKEGKFMVWSPHGPSGTISGSYDFDTLQEAILYFFLCASEES